MTYDYSMYVCKSRTGWDLCCNLVKGDSDHELSLYIQYSDLCFNFIDVLHDDFDYNSESITDYTVLDDVELFQASLVFDKNKYSCTIEDMIFIQNEMKRYVKENTFDTSTPTTSNYYFNTGE